MDGARWNASGSALAVISNFAKRQADRPEFGKGLSIRSVRSYVFERRILAAWTVRCCWRLLSLSRVTRGNKAFVSYEREKETVPLLQNVDYCNQHAARKKHLFLSSLYDVNYSPPDSSCIRLSEYDIVANDAKNAVKARKQTYLSLDLTIAVITRHVCLFVHWHVLQLQDGQFQNNNNKII